MSKYLSKYYCGNKTGLCNYNEPLPYSKVLDRTFDPEVIRRKEECNENVGVLGYCCDKKNDKIMNEESMERINKEFKEDIILNHGNSKYAQILLDPNAASKEKQNSSEIYQNLYLDFNNQRYSEVIERCDRYILDFNGEPIVTKFEFLKALAIARVYGFKEYKKALSFIKLNYSSTSEGKEAERILDEVLPLVKNDKFVSKNLSNNYKIVYKFDSSSSSINKQTNELKKYIDNVDYLDLTVSEDFYNNIITFVVVHGLKSYDGSLGLAERLENSIDIQAKSFFVISTENYKTIQIHKNLDKFEK